MNQTAQQEMPVFSIEKIYIKDLSVEVPNSPAIFLEGAAPEISLKLQNNGVKIADDIFDVSLTVNATAMIGEKTVFLVEVKQAGIFRIRNVPEDDIGPLLQIGCANILFPYARETISDAVSRAGFAPFVMQHVNFEALYLQQQQNASASEGVQEAEKAPEPELVA